MAGKFIEDFVVGAVDISPGRTVTETDVIAFSWVSGDTNPMHTDAEYSAKSSIGQRIAHGALGLSICTGLSARLGYLDGTAIAALGIDEWKFLKPIYLNDTVTLRSTVTEARPTSKPDRGVLVRRMELLNQHGELLQTGLMTTMVRTRATAGEYEQHGHREPVRPDGRAADGARERAGPAGEEPALAVDP